MWSSIVPAARTGSTGSQTAATMADAAIAIARPGKVLTQAAITAAAPTAESIAVARVGVTPTLAPGTAAAAVASQSNATRSG